MNKNKFDVIVVGVGTMGSSACYWLASNGMTVLGLEQFQSPHERGSHSGQSRIIRKAYFEHPDYVPLLERAYQNWRTLEENSGETVYYPTGIVYFGPSSHPIIESTRNAANLHQLTLESFNAEESISRFSQFNVDGYETIFEPDAGFLLPSRCISTYKKLAQSKGAVINSNETPEKNFIRPTRQVLVWIKPAIVDQFMPSNFPCWMLAPKNDEGIYYGFPYLDKSEFGEVSGLKFAYHFPGEPADPDNLQKQTTDDELQTIIKGLSEYFPPAKNEIVASSTCLYENSADGDFIIDYLPGYDNRVIIAGGFSGHGFKFASVVGEILYQMASEKIELPFEFLNLKRFEA
jgi:sarcosine oxidase